MTAAPIWPWLTLAGLGAFHGLNPAMGWLFAVALGLQRGSRAAVWAALPPIAAGHLLAVVTVAAAVVAAGSLVAPSTLRLAAGATLLGWAIYHWRFGHRHRVRFGMTVGAAGLAAWSAVMATAHGAGLMLTPALMPLCGAAGRFGVASPSGAAVTGLAAVLVHSAAMLAVMGVAAAAVYEWVGLAILRTGWINFDLLWSGVLATTGVGLMATV